MPSRARIAVLLGLTGGVLAVCCGWPDYAIQVAQDSPDAALDADETAPILEDAAAYDVATVACSDAGIRSGEALRCACSGDAADLDAAEDAEAGPVGHQACTLEGGLGACVGCPATGSCESVSAPIGTTCVPGGVVVLGAKNDKVCPPDGCPPEGPEHAVALSRFFLDDHEVTVKRFREWWAKGHVAPKADDVLHTAGDGREVKWQTEWSVREPLRADADNGATWLGDADSKNDDLPINYVDWPTAAAFCWAIGARLPTEAEWEAAASGRQGRLFPREAPETRNEAPSGAMLPCARAISAASGADCGAPNGDTIGTERYSADGVYDLAGSLAEWVLDVAPPGASSCTVGCYPSGPTADPILFVPGISARIVRGGAWTDTNPAALRAQARTFARADAQTKSIGFRCARR